MNRNGADIIHSIKDRWESQRQLFALLVSAAMSVFVIGMLHRFNGLNYAFVLLLFPAVWFFVWLADRENKVGNKEVTRLLNQQFPELEESTDLLLKTDLPGTMLEQLQSTKVASRLGTINPPEPFSKRLRIAFLLLGLSLMAAAAIQLIPTKSGVQNGTINSKNVVKETIAALPEINSVKIIIDPPAYTGLPTSTQSSYNIKAATGALVNWEIISSGKPKKLQFVFNDSSKLELVPADSSYMQWKASRQINKSGFYRIQLQERWSPFYTIEAVPDLPPVITVLSPKPHTTIDFGQPKKVLVTAAFRDDYGLKQSFISATVASGLGEAVKFREETIAFSSKPAGGTGYTLSAGIDLNKLGMQPGDELFFYINATDTRNQATRSDIFIVTLPDTAELMSMDGLVTALDIKPEFFRSQRQIIIETEQLLRDKATLSKEAFNEKSNYLGGEQKLLRLRYGKFLGEENETNIGPHEEHDEGGEKAGIHDESKEILAEVSHNHDIAEDATFFDPETKKQLRATLSEMWSAELKLRIYDPQAALPFEYKALLLLKDLQQQSRVYVAKTSAKTTPLDNGKRLSGDLSKISSPALHNNIEGAESDAAIVRSALGVLTEWSTNNEPGMQTLETLQQASKLLAAQAAIHPVDYLLAYQSLLRLMERNQKNQSLLKEDVRIASKGFYQLLPAAEKLPNRKSQGGVQLLSREYIHQLNQSKQ